MFEKEIVDEQLGTAANFIEMTRPLLTTSIGDMVDTILSLQEHQRTSYGVEAEIVKLQQREILNELALRN